MYTPYSPDKPVRFDPASVPALADTFAAIVPAAAFSPAEIQQHLLMYRVRPDIAVSRAPEMVERQSRVNFQAPKSEVRANGNLETKPEVKVGGNLETNGWKVVERKKHNNKADVIKTVPHPSASKQEEARAAQLARIKGNRYQALANLDEQSDDEEDSWDR